MQVIEGMSIADYHAHAAYSKSSLKMLCDTNKTPEHFWYEYKRPVKEERKTTPDLIFGNALHNYVLERDKFDAEYVVGPVVNKNSTVWKTFKKEAEETGKTVLSALDLKHIRGMAERLSEHSVASRLLPHKRPDALVEASFFWKDPETGVDLKVRPDVFLKDTNQGVDLKTTKSAAPSSFRNDIMSYGYDIQDAMIDSGIGINAKDVPSENIFICIEKEPPYAIAVYKLSHAYKAIGYSRFRHAVMTVADCELTDSWHGFSQDPIELEPPTWAAKQHETFQTEEEDYEPEEAEEAA